jgi:phosphatidate cytidylyltransferase
VSVSQQHSGRDHGIGEGVLRVLFGGFLAVVAIGLALSPWPELFAAITVLMTLFAAREWHRMVRAPAKAAEMDRQALHVQTIITGATTACALTAIVFKIVPAAFACLVLGTVASYIWAQRHDDNPVWHASGVLYIGLPSIALVALRVFPLQPQLIVLGLFLIVWATDTGALVFGKLIGGPKLAPHLSPGKTWAGTIGGSITATVVYGFYIALFGFDAESAMVFAFAFSFVAHGGDLFESLVKRRFGVKNSGGLIPGHGGMLDRVDSLFAASVVMAILVFGLSFNPLFGGRVL